MASRLERLETEILPQLSLCVPAAEPRNARHTRSLAVPDKRGAFCATQRAARSRAAPGNAGAHARRARRHQRAHQRRPLKHGEARLRRMFFCASRPLLLLFAARPDTRPSCAEPRSSAGSSRARAAGPAAGAAAAARAAAARVVAVQEAAAADTRTEKQTSPSASTTRSWCSSKDPSCNVRPHHHRSFCFLRCFAPLTLLSSYDMQSKTQR